MRRRIAVFVSLAVAATVLPPAISATAAGPASGDLGLMRAVPVAPENFDDVPHWSIEAPTTRQATLSEDDGTLVLSSTTGGAAVGTESMAAGAASSGSQPDAAGEWPTGNRDRARTGNAAWEEFITVPAGSAWTATTTDKVQLNPAIVDDVAYFGGAGADRRVYAVDLQTGNMRWNVQIPGSVLSSPTVANGWVYFGGADGRIYRLSASRGELSWQYPGAASNPVGGFIGATALFEGVLYAGSLDAKLYAIDATSGQLLWSASTPEAVTAGITVGNGKVFVISGANEWLTAFDISTHAQAWQRHFYTWDNPSTLGTAASYSSSRIFLTGLDSLLHILDDASGTDIASSSLGSWAQNTPVPAAQKVFVGTNNGRVLAFDRGGSPLWSETLTNSGIVASPVYAAGRVFASNTDGALYALDAETGASEWQYVTDGALFAPPAIVSNHILVGSDDHNLYGLVPGLPDNRSYAPPPPRSHTYGMWPFMLFAWDPVATSTGNYVYQTRDLALPGRGVPLRFTRTYNSMDAATAGPLGYGWTFDTNPTLSADAGTVTIRWGDGHTDTYTGSGPTYASPPDVDDTLTSAGGEWDLETISHLRYHFDSAGKLAAVVDSSGNQLSFAYASGRLVSLTDASAHTVTLGYDATDRIVSVTDPLDRSWTFTYDPSGNLETASDNAGHTWRYGYDNAHHLTTVTDPDDNLVIQNTYDPEGRVTQQIDSADAIWEYTYNSGNTVVTDPLGHATTYVYDANFRTTAVTDALGHTSRWIYDERSNLVATVDETGRANQFHYDENGNLTAALDPLGHKIAYAYDASNNPVAVTNLKGVAATFAYDTANRLTDITTPTGVHTGIAYRSDGLIDSITDGAGKTTRYGYDANGMLRTVTDPLNRVTQIAVDAAGQVTSITDPLIRTTAYRFDSSGRMDEVTDALGHTVGYGYDNTGRMTAITDQNGHTTRYTYDGRGLITAITDALDRTRRAGYDLARRLTSITNARGQVIRYAYDEADRLSDIDYPDAPDVSYTRDDAGRPLTMSDGTGTTTYEYDNGGRLASEHRALANTTLAYTYDLLSRRSELAVHRSGGLTAHNTYGYDADGRLTLLSDSAGGDTLIDYDPAGRLATLSSPNGVTATYTYDAAGQVTDITTARAAVATGSAKLISGYRYAYDAAGQRINVIRSVADQSFTSTYGYDRLGRLISATTTDPQAPPEANGAWTYDNAGNRASRTVAGALPTTYSYDAADQLLSDGIRDYAWDADGNLTTRREHLGGNILARYTWDAANRITSQTTADQSTSYNYDGNGRRVGKTDPTGSSTYLYDGWDLVEELSSGGGDAVETTAGGLVLNRITAAGAGYLHADGNANISEITNADGLVQSRYAYAPWGSHNSVPASATDPYLNRHTFGGAAGVRDDNGTLIDMRNRMYDTSLGRFISRDPWPGALGGPSTVNRYHYAENDPISNIDPLGLMCLQWDFWNCDLSRVKEFLGGVAVVAGGAALIASGVGAPEGAALLGFFSFGVGAGQASLECIDGGGFDQKCATNVASTLISGNSVVLGEFVGEAAQFGLHAISFGATVVGNVQLTDCGCTVPVVIGIANTGNK